MNKTFQMKGSMLFVVKFLSSFSSIVLLSIVSGECMLGVTEGSGIVSPRKTVGDKCAFPVALFCSPSKQLVLENDAADNGGDKDDIDGESDEGKANFLLLRNLLVLVWGLLPVSLIFAHDTDELNIILLAALEEVEHLLGSFLTSWSVKFSLEEMFFASHVYAWGSPLLSLTLTALRRLLKKLPPFLVPDVDGDSAPVIGQALTDLFEFGVVLV
jgi:hypothetical protein